MSVQVIFDWKTVVALGASTALTISACKLDSEAAGTISIKAIETTKDLVTAISNR